MDKERRKPCDGALTDRNGGRPFPAELTFNGGYCGNAWGVKQAEGKQACRRKGRYGFEQLCGRAEKNRKGGNYAFLCHKSGNNRGGNTPVSES